MVASLRRSSETLSIGGMAWTKQAEHLEIWLVGLSRTKCLGSRSAGETQESNRHTPGYLDEDSLILAKRVECGSKMSQPKNLRNDMPWIEIDYYSEMYKVGGGNNQ